MTKKCIQCGKHVQASVPVYKRGTVCGTEEDYSKQVICNTCLKSSEEYAYCCCCGEEGAYSTKDMLTDEFSWYCKEHIDESSFEEEEESGWRSYISYIND
ncbi:hypothetical protein [Lysinibacillus fusiformis]|uniref:hypothetical protein n=1 Tax=Lysinibacillus fusiformis TaxID=28031 RepID=UPI003556443C